jgi:hypothetical protein
MAFLFDWGDYADFLGNIRVLKTATVAVFKTGKIGPVYRVGPFSRFGFIEKPVGYPYRAVAVRSVTAVTDRFTANLRTQGNIL